MLKKKMRMQYKWEKFICTVYNVSVYSNLIDISIKTEQNKKWCQLLSNLKPCDKSLCKLYRSLWGKGKNQIYYINFRNTKITSNKEKAEILANIFVQANNLTSNYIHLIDKSINDKVN